jgi:hypothetical protein
MTSRCITYERGRCLIEVATADSPGAPHVAHLYLVDRADEGEVVRPLIDLEGHPLSLLGTSAAMAIRAARRYLRLIFGAPLMLQPCALADAAMGRPVIVAEPTPERETVSWIGRPWRSPHSF